MNRLLYCFLFLFYIHFHVYSQSYISQYDVLEERLTLNNDGSFQFELIDPLDENKKVLGDFVRIGDTLVFNKGKYQNSIKVSQCECGFSIEREGYYVKFIDEKGRTLRRVETMLASKRLRTDNDGLVALPKGGFPVLLSVSLLQLSDKLWANPYQKVWFEVSLKCGNGSGNLLIVQLDLSDDFKIPFEYETKLYKKDSQLHYVMDSGLLEGLTFRLDTLHRDVEGESKKASEQLTPENAFEFREIETFTRYFTPSLVDAFWDDFKSKDASALYNGATEQVKKAQTLEDFKIYFRMIESFYGKIKENSIESSSVKNMPFGRGVLARRIYGVSFEHCTGKVIAHFNVVNRDSILLAGIQLELDDYTSVPKVEQITKKSVSAIKAKDSKALYQQTSARFKEYSSIAEFESFTTKLFESGVDDIKIFQSSIGVQNKMPIMFAVYELPDNYLRLTFVESEGKYALEGINLLPSK